MSVNLFKYQQFTICQEHAAMKVGTDSDLLGTLGEGGHRILDIGTGTGVLSLMFAQRYPEAQITAVEIDDNAILDASRNFAESKFADRITLHHSSFQDFLKLRITNSELRGESSALDQESYLFDSVICNPPYFDKSLECPDLGRSRARHSSSLPFDVLARGAYDLLKDGGVFSVCIPPEVLDAFCAECAFAGFALKDCYQIKSLPHKPPKRYVLVHQKGLTQPTRSYTFCMRNEDHSRSEWYKELMKDFLCTHNKN